MIEPITPEEERWIVRMRVGGLGYEALCEATGRSKDTIQRLLSRYSLAPDPALRGEEPTPTMFACPKCGFRCKATKGHDSCQRRTF